MPQALSNGSRCRRRNVPCLRYRWQETCERWSFQTARSYARLCTMLLSNRPHKKAEKESNWGLKPHQDQWVMWEKRNYHPDAASRLTIHHETSLPVCDTSTLRP